jgi:hypothetical protein
VRYAILVDAGYLLGAGGWATTGTPRRGDLAVDHANLVAMLTRRGVKACPGKELLRLYWYDAGPSRQPNADQLRIAELADTKLRMGHLTTRGEQKGVDGLILSDLMELARVGAIHTAVLVAGDGDLVEAVSQSQRAGVRVVLWGIVDTPQSTVSPDLRREADRYDPLTRGELDPFFSRIPIQPEVTEVTEVARTEARVPEPTSDSLPVYVALSPDDALSLGRDFARRWKLRITSSELERAVAQRPSVPSDADAQLIRFAIVESDLPGGTRLAAETLRELRDGFWEIVGAT